MDDERIARLLRSLPREEALPSFTAGVLGRLERSEKARRRRISPVSRLAAATAALMLIAGVFGLREMEKDRARQRERREAIARLEVLEAQKSALYEEIRALRRQARDARPVVYLGSTPELDVVVDLSRIVRRRAEKASIPPHRLREPAMPRFVRHSSQGESFR